MSENDEPRSLSTALDGVVRSLQGGAAGATGGRAVGSVFGRWAEIVGEPVAAHVQPIRLDRARLVVEVSDPAWATQVRLLSDRICERIAEVTGSTVKSVEVRVVGPGRP